MNIAFMIVIAFIVGVAVFALLGLIQVEDDEDNSGYYGSGGSSTWTPRAVQVFGMHGESDDSETPAPEPEEPKPWLPKKVTCPHCGGKADPESGICESCGNSVYTVPDILALNGKK